MKKAIQFSGLLVLIFMLQLTASSQTVSFGYDACGNRISREILLPPMSNVQANPEDPNAGERELTDLYETEVGEVQVQISPNPNGGQFKVTLQGITISTDAKLYLHAANGQLILEKEKLQAMNNIDIRHKQNGTYILTFLINGRRESWKVIKQ